jgi:hypothetical protein
MQPARLEYYTNDKLKEEMIESALVHPPPPAHFDRSGGHMLSSDWSEDVASCSVISCVAPGVQMIKIESGDHKMYNFHYKITIFNLYTV